MQLEQLQAQLDHQEQSPPFERGLVCCDLRCLSFDSVRAEQQEQRKRVAAMVLEHEHEITYTNTTQQAQQCAIAGVRRGQTDARNNFAFAFAFAFRVCFPIAIAWFPNFGSGPSDGKQNAGVCNTPMESCALMWLFVLVVADWVFSFEFVLVVRQVTRLLDSNPSRDPLPWVPDSAGDSCLLCSVNFAFYRRRHHCRCVHLVLF